MIARADLRNFDCGACPEALRQARGCHGGCRDSEGRPAINAGTRWATDTCPRRHLLRNPDLIGALQLHADLDSVGIGEIERLSEQAMQALTLIDDARAHRQEDGDG